MGPMMIQIISRIATEGLAIASTRFAAVCRRGSAYCVSRSSSLVKAWRSFSSSREIVERLQGRGRP
jgi:hypothetical protein